MVRKANASGLFSILADEASDVSNREILCYSVRFLPEGVSEYRGNKCICRGNMESNKYAYILQAFVPTEWFLGYYRVEDLTGKGLADAIIKCMIDSGLNVSYLIGQGYDGAAAMAGIALHLALYLHSIRKQISGLTSV